MHQPVRRGAELRLAHTETRVDRGTPRSGELTGQSADGLGRHPGAALGVLGCHLAHELLHRSEPVDVRLGPTRMREAFRDDDVRHGREEEGVGAGLDEDMLIGDVGGLGASRVDDDEPAASLAQALESALDVGRGHDRAVGDERVATDDEQEVGAIDVGHREQQGRAEEQVRQQVLGLLVDTRRGVAIAGAQRLEQLRDVDDGRPAVGDRVAQVEADGVPAVARADVEESRGDEVECLAPGHLLPAIPHAACRAA